MPNCKVFPGLNNTLNNLKEESLFWHRIWKSNGCPEAGAIADLKKKARFCYHYAICDARRNQQHHRAQKIAESILQSNNCQFWAKVKKLNSSKCKYPTCVDGVSGTKDICEVFVNKYKTLFNSLSYDDIEIDDIRNEIKNKMQLCSDGKCYNNHQISYDMVCKAISRFKMCKSDGSSEQTSDHFINGTKKLVYIYHCCAKLF